MYSKHHFLLLLIWVVSGCDKGPSIEFVSHTNSEDDISICQDVSCPEVTVNYISLEGDTEVVDKINTKIKYYIIKTLHLGDNEKSSESRSIVGAIEDFIQMYRTHNAEFPDMSAEYFADVSVTSLYNSKEIISLELSQYIYSGGAHGNGYVQFMNIDPKTGEEISLNDLVTDHSEFTTFVEIKFREKFSIPVQSNINSTGYWFHDDKFYLPTAIGLTANSILIHYNPYEIDSYAAGPIELEIPREEVRQFLNYL